MPSFLENELSRDGHLSYNQTKDEATEYLWPKLPSRFKDAFVDIEVVMRPQYSAEEAEHGTGKQHNRRNDGEHHAHNNNKHVLGQNFMEWEPPRIIDCSHSNPDGSLFTKG